MIMFYHDYKSHFIKKTILAHVIKKAEDLPTSLHFLINVYDVHFLECTKPLQCFL